MDKVAVLGLGESIKLFDPLEFEMTIGVNDIWSIFKTKAVVCVDTKARFTPERQKVIDECTPEAFYSQLNSYSDRPDFKKIDLLPYFPDYICQLDIPQIPKSLCSPFIACIIAYKFYDAREIHLFGVDMTNHPNIDAGMCKRIKVHFKNLKISLRKKGRNIIIHGDGILKNL
jgi:hypothetical protein